jgi:hypothetical protein
VTPDAKGVTTLLTTELFQTPFYPAFANAGARQDCHGPVQPLTPGATVL